MLRVDPDVGHARLGVQARPGAGRMDVAADGRAFALAWLEGLSAAAASSGKPSMHPTIGLEDGRFVVQQLHSPDELPESTTAARPAIAAYASAIAGRVSYTGPVAALNLAV